MGFLDVIAGSQAGYLQLIKLTVIIVLYIFNTSVIENKIGLFDQPG